MDKEAQHERGNMPIVNLDGGTVTIEVGYGLTVNKGDFNSERLDVRLTEQFPNQVGATAQVEAELMQHAQTLEAAVKTYVAQALGIEAAFDANGHLQPVIGAVTPTTLTAATPISSAPSAPQQQGGSPFGSTAKTTPQQREQLPTYALDFGHGVREYVDQRPLKEAGVYKPTAPDFKDANDRNAKGIWLTQKNGSIRSDYAAVLQAAGIAV